jgi:hypothetical protein
LALSRSALFGTRLGLFLAGLAFLSQALALPMHRMAGPADVAEIASELKASFGDAAVLCTQADRDDPGAPLPVGHCDDHCPLCQAGAGALATILPDVSHTAVRENKMAEAIPPPTESGVFAPRRISQAQPRAPPAEV